MCSYVATKKWSTTRESACYRLSHGNSYVSIGPTFNVGKSTVIEAVQDVVNALFDASDQFIKFPTTPAETAASIETFRENTRSELVNVAGAIDGTHIKIIAPRENALDYFSRYQQHDFIIQEVVSVSIDNEYEYENESISHSYSLSFL